MLVVVAEVATLLWVALAALAVAVAVEQVMRLLNLPLVQTELEILAAEVVVQAITLQILQVTAATAALVS